MTVSIGQDVFPTILKQEEGQPNGTLSLTEKR